MNHKTVPVVMGRIVLDIDEALAPLMPLLWLRGIETVACCQESHPGLASIRFVSTNDVEMFLFAAQRHYLVEVETVDTGQNGTMCVGVHLLVFFPVADISRLVEILTVPQSRTSRAKKPRKGRRDGK